MNAVRVGSCLGAVLLGSTFLSTAALAQTQTTDVPIRQFKDDNGVDLLSGTFTTTTGVAVGDGENGLEFTREIRGAYALDNMLGEIKISGSTYTVTLGGSAEKFTLSGGVFTPTEQNGSTLTLSGSNYTYRRADGTTAVFAVPPANYYQFGNARGIVPTSVTYPNGKVLTFNYTVGSFTPPGSPQVVYGRRLGSVTSNTAYSISFTYETNVLGQTNSHLWTHVTNVSTGGGPSLAVSPITGETPGVRDYTDAMGRVTRYTFNGAGSTVSAIRLPGSASNDITVSYASGRVSAVTAFGVTTTYSYADVGNIRTTTVTRGSNPSSIYKFDLNKLVMTWHQNELGHITQYQHDASNRVTRITRPEQNYVEFSYDGRGNVTTTTAVPKPSVGGSPISTHAGYDATCTVAVKCNKPNWTKDAKGNQTDYTYDTTHGGLLTATAPAPTTGAVRPQTRITYVRVNSSGVEGSVGVFKPKTISSCRTLASCIGTDDEARTTFTYGNNQNVATITTAAGNGTLSGTTSLTYDNAGNLTAVDGPLAGTDDRTVAFYNAARQLTGTIGPDPDGTGSAQFAAQRITYDTAGRPYLVEQGHTTAQTSAALTSMSVIGSNLTTYDPQRRPVTRAARGSNGATYSLTETSYNALGQVDCVAQRMDAGALATPLGNACALGTEGTFGPDRIVKYTYDAAGRRTKATNAFGTSLASDEYTLTFTNNGQVATVKDAENNLTTYEYDGHDRNVKVRFPVATKGANSSSTTDFEEYTFDKNNNVLTFRTRRNETIELAYDDLNRLVTKLVPDRSGLATTHTRNVYFGYDLLSNMTYARFDSTSGEGITNTFTALGHLTSTTTNMDGVSRTLSYWYDDARNRTRITHPDGTHVYYHRTPSGGLYYSDINGSGLFYPVRDSAGRPTYLFRWNTWGWGPHTSYSYDTASRLASLMTNVNDTPYDATTSFSYNPASQIASATRDNDTYAFNGHVNVNRGYTSNGLNQYSAVAGTSFGYDANGNLTSDGGNAFVYDVENRLVSRSGGGTSATLRYDPLGRLYEVNGSASGITRFLHDGNDLVAEYDSAGTMQRRFVHGTSAGDDPLVWFEGGGVHDAARRYLYADERGSIVAVTDATGNAIAINRYDEYGIPAAGNAGRFQYTGQAWIPELGMYYYKARMYSPTLGRFMQTDPIGYGDGMNMYRYVGNDPVNGVDPSGLAWQKLPPTCTPVSVVWPGQLSAPSLKCEDNGYVWVDEAQHQHQPTPSSGPVSSGTPGGNAGAATTQNHPNVRRSIIRMRDYCGSNGSEWVADGNWGEACAWHDACYAAQAGKEYCDAMLGLLMAGVISLKELSISPKPVLTGLFYSAGLILSGLWEGGPSRRAYNEAKGR